MRERKNCVICNNSEAESFTDATNDTDYGIVTIVMKCPKCTKFKVTSVENLNCVAYHPLSASG
jgi:hypothetical protein